MNKPSMIANIKLLASKGLSNAIIAKRLGINYQMVKNHTKGMKERKVHEGTEPVEVYNTLWVEKSYKGLGD